MKLKRLLRNQRIRIDNHRCGQILDRDMEKVHFHKTFIGDNERKYLKIYFNGRIDFSNGFKEKEKAPLLNEIRDVIEENQETLIELSETLGKALYDWSEGTVTLEKAQGYAHSIAISFGLEYKIQKEFIIKVTNSLKSYILRGAESTLH